MEIVPFSLNTTQAHFIVAFSEGAVAAPLQLTAHDMIGLSMLCPPSCLT